MTAATFESMRLIVIIFALLLKMILMPMYLQSYLNLAIQKLENQKKEAGRITNVELQKKANIKIINNIRVIIFIYIYIHKYLESKHHI